MDAPDLGYVQRLFLTLFIPLARKNGGEGGKKGRMEDSVVVYLFLFFCHQTTCTKKTK